MANQQQQRVIRVRAHDGRSTAVTLAAAATVQDLKTALRSSFAPALASRDFHLFLKGVNLLADAKVGNLPIAHGDSLSFIPVAAAKPTPPSTTAPPNIFSGKKRKFSWRGGEDIYAKIAKPTPPPPPPPSPAAISCHGMLPLNPTQMVEHLREGMGKSGGQITHSEEIPGREAMFSDLPIHLSSAMRNALRSIGITKLYTHQSLAVKSAVDGEHVVVSTSTSSGKSLCYNIPVLESISQSSSPCALYIFPTKALAQDQLKTLLEMKPAFSQSEFDVSIYDGDTAMKDRTRIRNNARLLITNPDMLHMSILPCHGQFKRILSNLRYIVVDEAHYYKGAFGCHAALILRRLKRICSSVYGCNPTFIFCTATLANPREHVMELAKLDRVVLVENDASPCGSKKFLLWNPPITAQERRSNPVLEVSRLFAEMVQHGLRCIAFCKTRKMCEQVLIQTRQILQKTASELVDSICVYRGGYVASDRRQIEADLFGGKLRGVAATNALELGIDVGHIDATLHLGFPGSMASFWQQAGRSGRRSKQSIDVYVAFDGALDQYFMRSPHKLFGKPVEHCQVDSHNHKVLEQQLACAASEYSLRSEYDECYFGSSMNSVITTLKDKGCLINNSSGGNSGVWKYIGHDKKPSQNVSIRAIEHHRYKVIDRKSNRVLEEIEESKAFFQVYEGAIYMHQGVSYLVDKIDLCSRIAYCKVFDLDYYTKVKDYTEISFIGGDVDEHPASQCKPDITRTTAQANACKVTTRWVGFDRILKSINQKSDTITFNHLPPYSFETQAVWVQIPQSVRATVEQRGSQFLHGVHAASHALLSILPLHMMCNGSDLGTQCAEPQGNSETSDRILLYDKHSGGIGLASQAKLLFGELLASALELVETCSCTNFDGCPSCIQSFACSDCIKNLDKEAAILILKGLIQYEKLYF
uniref:RNA helicase n=1 Tax=Leersia perrieri TaxID=77586 RepID=A0A0D9VB94_9ORYZ